MASFWMLVPCQGPRPPSQPLFPLGMHRRRGWGQQNPPTPLSWGLSHRQHLEAGPLPRQRSSQGLSEGLISSEMAQEVGEPSAQGLTEAAASLGTCCPRAASPCTAGHSAHGTGPVPSPQGLRCKWAAVPFASMGVPADSHAQLHSGLWHPSQWAQLARVTVRPLCARDGLTSQNLHVPCKLRSLIRLQCPPGVHAGPQPLWCPLLRPAPPRPPGENPRQELGPRCTGAGPSPPSVWSGRAPRPLGRQRPCCGQGAAGAKCTSPTSWCLTWMWPVGLREGLLVEGPGLRLRVSVCSPPGARWHRPGRAEVAPVVPAECQMVVLLHLTRSYESLRRHREVSESKRCLEPPPMGRTWWGQQMSPAGAAPTGKSPAGGQCSCAPHGRAPQALRSRTCSTWPWPRPRDGYRRQCPGQ